MFHQPTPGALIPEGQVLCFLRRERGFRFFGSIFLVENQPSNAEELLSPQPSHKLLVLAAPLRVHNQTDLTLVLRPRLERRKGNPCIWKRTYPMEFPLHWRGLLECIPRFFWCCQQQQQQRRQQQQQQQVLLRYFNIGSIWSQICGASCFGAMLFRFP